MAADPLGARDTLDTTGGPVHYYRLDRAADEFGVDLDRLPFSIKVLLENALRNAGEGPVTREDVENLARYEPSAPAEVEIPFSPARVLLQDFTGVPAVVDLAALRSAMARNGGDPEAINPRVPVDLVIDHSVQVDSFALPEAFQINADIEFQRNQERYEFLRWGSKAFDNFSVVPPERGICHQVNLEYIAKGVWTTEGDDGVKVAYPDSLVGTDSHTTMINGLGVLGWGVGGIEAEAAMLGQPIYMLMPKVVGFRLSGKLREGVTATDLTLTVTQMLRAHGVVGKFVEFYGPGLSSMSLPDRATIANMAPEYGATMGFFPIDAETVDYLRRTNRDADTIDLVEKYTKAQGLFRTDDLAEPEFEATLELDLAEVQPSMSGPKRPQDRIVLGDVQREFRESLTRPASPQGFGYSEDALDNTGRYADQEGNELDLKHGDVVIAAITSCTNTSNPSVMLAAGLLAQKAVERGMEVKPYVKTSLAPGSRVVTAYLEKAGLQDSLDQLGYNLVGYGCTTCIGNSGPLPEPVAKAITDGDLVVSGVLSGNRNFEGRIHSLVKANYLASPPLVVAYALAGTVDIDLQNDVIGQDRDGNDVYLRDLWPSQKEITDAISQAVTPDQFKELYEGIEESNPRWNAIATSEGAAYDWQDDSTYIQEPPFFFDVTQEVPAIQPITGARALVKVGDSTTTDHISPAGAIPKGEPAGQYLQDHGVEPKDFNSFGSRRGNDRVMTRGTFANIRLRNQLAPGTEGGWSRHLPDGEDGYVYDVAMRYREEGTPLVAFAGDDYGMGSSRDWAAKGTLLLGVKAVVAKSFERIHRSNLIGMGVLPLTFQGDDGLETFGLDGTETFDVPVSDDLTPGDVLTITATKDDGAEVTFDVDVALNTPVEVEYYRHGGILNYVLRDFLSTELQPA
ncbi:aconitate hydratase AcnA [Rubrivirga sp. S365]|uniref:aconitate hydratase AcnA n=1 Tax=Rubrivirga sp. S365 TaxID=3076080 RepID=UPI0028C9E020|nr:aconitate hydratase AcnA [Rubrivirga sp. S365]MDT7855830.1 aconitate hydratase AcnA [Rubrivirga sp. S365]